MNIFKLAQQYLAENRSVPAPKPEVLKPLAGLIVCGKCGRKMVRRPYSSGQPDSLICPVTSCDNVSSYLHFVEERLLHSLEEWLEAYKLDLETADKDQHDDMEIELIKKAIDNCDKEMKR